MRRIHAFELEDQPWFPRILRDAGTAFLRFAAERGKHAEAMRPIVEDALDRGGATEIVDLCSGGGGPIVGIAAAMRARGRHVAVTLTDLYPSATARELDDGVTYLGEPVDATAVPRDRRGLRTVCNAFHHFRPPLATRILANAVDAGQPIAIVEVAQRRWLALFLMLFIPIVAVFSVPFLRPFRLAWIPLTLVPIIPLFIWWDGTISMLRAYDRDELLAMARAADPDRRFDWRVHDIALPGSPLRGISLVGVPARG